LHPDWVLGFADETWWSRLTQPQMHTWTDGQGQRLQELEAKKGDPDPKALCCYGLLRRDIEKLLLRFVDGRPVSQVTIGFLEWVCERLAEESKKAVVLVWDNATWHKSQKVRSWINEHNRKAKPEGGVTNYSNASANQESLAKSD